MIYEIHLYVPKTGTLTPAMLEWLFENGQSDDQPEAFSGGQTAVVPRSRINAEEEAKPMFKFGPGTTLDEIVRAVNQVGAAPSDLMAILEALKQAGALQADLIVI